jgi:hypothetical protein
MVVPGAAELGAEEARAVSSVSGGSSISNETAKSREGRDGGTHAPEPVSVNAPTVAVRVVALAAVAGPAGQHPRPGVSPEPEGRRTEAS